MTPKPHRRTIDVRVDADALKPLARSLVTLRRCCVTHEPCTRCPTGTRCMADEDQMRRRT